MPGGLIQSLCMAGVLFAGACPCASTAPENREAAEAAQAAHVAPSVLAPVRVSIASGEPVPDLPGTLDLKTAQREALANNPSLLEVGAQVAQARAQVKQVRSLYFPQLDAGYSAAYVWISDADREAVQETLDSNEDTIVGLDNFVSGGSFDLPRRTIRNQRRTLRHNLADIEEARADLEGPAENYSIEITAGYLLFDGFSRKFTNAMAKFGRGEIEEAQREAQRLLLSAVAQSFYGVQLARENIEVALADAGFNRRLLNDAKARRARGKGATSDILNFEVRLRVAQTALLLAVGDHEAARLALALLMGRPGGLLPDDTFVSGLAAETPEEMAVPDAGHALRYALEHRPDLVQRAFGVQRAKAGVKQRYGEFYPQVSLFASWGASRTGDSKFREDDFSTALGLNVSYNLFSGGRRRAQLTEAKHAQRAAEFGMNDAELKALSEVRNALLELGISQQQLILQRATTEYVQKNRDLVEKGFNAGKAALVRLNQAQRDLVDAQVRLTLARVSVRKSWYELRTATAESLADFQEDPN